MKYLLHLVLLLFTAFCFAEPPELTETERQVIAFTWNAQWQQADSILDAKIKEDPANPRYYYMKLPLYYYTRYYNNGALNGDSLMQLVGEYAQKTIDAAELQEESDENNFYLGSAYGYLSRHYIRLGERWDAYWAARNASGYLEDVIDSDPAFYDAYQELAVQEYFTSRLTGWLGTLAWFAGMSGDRETALEYFHLVSENGRLCKYEADFALGAVYRFFEFDYTSSYRITSEMRDRYPNNSFLENQYHQVLLMQAVEKDGVAVLTALDQETLIEKYHINNSGILNQLGYNFVNQSRLDDAVTVFKLNIKMYPEIANVYDSMSECYETMGDAENSLHYARIALEKLPADSTINEDFRQLLREGLEQRIENLVGEVPVAKTTT